MGYSTDFKGELKFTSPVTTEALAYLNGFLGQDRREFGYDGNRIQELGYGSYWCHIDYELLPDFSGIRWNGSEKSYEMEHVANFLIDKMREKYPDFGLSGRLLAQGDDIDDRWELVFDQAGRACRREIRPAGRAIRCPHCEGKVYPHEAETYPA